VSLPTGSPADTTTPERRHRNGFEEQDMADHANTIDQRIVVGVDGSECSKNALAWALTQARWTGATVEAVSAWQEPAMYGFIYASAPAVFEGEGISSLTAKVLQETVAEVTDHAGAPVDVVTRTVEGPPAQVLLQAAAGAQLLVVGSRGHGAFSGMLLGSVSQHCVQQAPCPVTVIPQ
jgi:nucleotide-binding universal stress UspA family protein